MSFPNKIAGVFFFVVFVDVAFNQNPSNSPVSRSNSTDANKDHCNKTVDIYDDILSPKLTPETYGKPMHCWYRFRSFRGTTPREWVLRIRFKKFKFGTLINATDCVGGFMQIVDGNAKTNLSNRKDPGMFCGEIEQMQTFISETSFVKISFQTDNFTDQTYYSFDTRAEQEFDLYPRYGKHPELYPNRRGQIVSGTYCQRLFKDCKLQTCYVQSPAYPGIYPRGLHCTYQLSTRLPFIKLYIENEEFNVDGQRCENIITCPMRPISAGIQHCPYDYLRIYDGKNANSKEIGTFCGMGKFPFSIIGSSQDLFVEFITSRAGPLLNTGFHFNVGNWPGHVETAGVKNGTCNWILSSKDLNELGTTEGIFLSIVHWYPPRMRCTYLIQGSPNQVVRVYFPSLRINKIESPIEPYDGDCGESLTLYDSDQPDDSKIIKTFCNTFSRAMEKHDFISTKNALFVSFDSKTGSYSGSSIYYWAHYDFFNNTKFGTPVPGTDCDEEFSGWKKESGVFRSPVNTLIYKKITPDTIRCRYKFVTDRRIFARVLLTIESYYFKPHPYRTTSCTNCWLDKTDKIILWEPQLTTNETRLVEGSSPKSICLCTNGTERVTKRITFSSLTESASLEMQIEPAYSAANYFKANFSLFEASYKFVHGPLCGPAVYKPAIEGELHFPYYEALGFIESPRSIHCVWDIQVNRNHDLSLHFEKIKFVSRDCQDGRLEIHLPSMEKTFLTICGHNVSAALRGFRIITMGEITPKLGTDPNRYLQIHFIGHTTPARANFKIVWSELHHLPRNADGSAKTKTNQG